MKYKQFFYVFPLFECTSRQFVKVTDNNLDYFRKKLKRIRQRSLYFYIVKCCRKLALKSYNNLVYMLIKCPNYIYIGIFFLEAQTSFVHNVALMENALLIFNKVLV